MSAMPAYVYLRAPRRWHRGVVVNGQVLTGERCNIDDARIRLRATHEPDPDAPRCRWCWGASGPGAGG